MGKTAVIYKSRYGSAKQYAKWIESALDADLFELGSTTADQLDAYSTIIYGAGLYAGQISGFKQFKGIFNRYNNKNFILFTVSLMSVDHPEKFAPMLAASFTPEMHARVKTFHFRGGIDYKGLSFPHRLVMTVLSKLLSLKKPKELTDDQKGIISTYGKSVSFLDEAAIEPLLKQVCAF